MRKARLAGTDPNLSLLDYRNTPTEGIGSSPAQRLFGRRTKTLVPTSTRLLVSEAARGVPHKLKERKAKQAFYYDRCGVFTPAWSLGACIGRSRVVT